MHEEKPTPRAPVEPAFLLAVLGSAGAYLALSVVYILRLPLVMDEFQGAEVVHRLSRDLPYRDFLPYKTVLGYLIQKPLLAVGGSTWSGLMSIKIGMAAINAAALAGAALVLRRHFRRAAVLSGLAMTVVMSTLLERGADLRVDMLTAVAGLAALLALLERRYLLAGFLVALSFCISQKGVYYVLSSQAALAAAWIVWPERRSESLRAILRFSAASAAGLAAYLLLWGLASSLPTVVEATFLSHGAIALGDLYDIQLRYWGQTLERNPLFYALALVGLLFLDRRRRSRNAAWLLVPYGAVLIALCAWHKQPWPYFFVLLIPTIFVLGVAAIDRILDGKLAERGSARLVLVALFLAFGIVWPLLRVPANLKRDSGVQRRTIEVAESVLGEGETYLAGVNFLYRRRQVHPDLEWLDRTAATRLREASAGDHDATIGEIEQAPAKLIVDSYRIQQLPDAWRRYLGSHYSHLAANVFIRSRVLSPEDAEFELAFAGEYLVESPRPGEFTIDGRSVRTGDRIELAAGAHTYSGEVSRLKLWPPSTLIPPEEHREPAALFPDVYDY